MLLSVPFLIIPHASFALLDVSQHCADVFMKLFVTNPEFSVVSYIDLEAIIFCKHRTAFPVCFSLHPCTLNFLVVLLSHKAVQSLHCQSLSLQPGAT